MAARRRPPVPLTIQIDAEPKFFFDKLRRLDRTIVDVKNTEKRIEETIIKMKYMNMKDVREIFSEVNDKLSIEYDVVPDPDREVIRIIKPEEKAGQLFYKSTGSSRLDKSIAGVWFPFIGKNKRFVKLEDKYIDAYNSFEGGVKFEDISDEDKSAMLDLIRNPNLFTYARFIDYANASISARLHTVI